MSTRLEETIGIVKEYMQNVKKLRWHVRYHLQRHGTGKPGGSLEAMDDLSLKLDEATADSIAQTLLSQHEENAQLTAALRTAGSALKASRDWIAPVVEGFGVHEDAADHVVVKEIDAAIVTLEPFLLSQ